MVFIYRTSSSALDCMHCYFGGLMHSLYFWTVNSESRSVVSDSLWPHRQNRPWVSLGQDTGVGSFSLLQRIFPTQGSNPGPLHCEWILYQLSHKRSPRIPHRQNRPWVSLGQDTGVGSLSLLQRIIYWASAITRLLHLQRIFFILWNSMSNNFFVLKTVIP